MITIRRKMMHLLNGCIRCICQIKGKLKRSKKIKNQFKMDKKLFYYRKIPHFLPPNGNNVASIKQIAFFSINGSFNSFSNSTQRWGIWFLFLWVYDLFNNAFNPIHYSPFLGCSPMVRVKRPPSTKSVTPIL